MPRIKLILTALSLVIVQAVFAQGQRISGTVNDEFGPVMMANVTERDANNRIVTAAVTDINGNFTMVIKNPNNKLSVSYVGAKTQTMAIGAKTRFNITMGSSATTVQEVTVTSKKNSNLGGMAIPKREVSVASQTMDMSEVEGLSFTSADEALQGKIAGLDIVANSGNLGSGTQMRLRGITSINGNKDPLIVVDGQIYDTPDDFTAENATEEDYASLLSVNVEDIQSITVLKDAASTALWGSKGANGVIEITTKRGARGKTVVGYSYKFTGSWQPQGYKLLTGDQYTMMMKEAIYNRDQTADATTGIDELNYNTSWYDYENWNNNTDWVDAVTQFGQKHSHSLTITGGGEKANFRISAGYDRETGTIIEQSLNRFTTRMVLDYFVSDRIKFSTNFAFTYTNNNKNYDDYILRRAQRIAPNMSIYQQDGNGNDTGEYYIMPTTTSTNDELSAVQSEVNPVAVANLAWRKDNTYRVTPDFILQYDLLGVEPGKHRLTYKGDVYFDIYAQSKPSYYPGSLTKTSWNDSDDNYNRSYNYEYNRMAITVTNELTYTPHFNNEDWTGFIRAKYQAYSANSDSQEETITRLPNGISSSTVNASSVSASSSTSRSRTQNWSLYTHVSYKSRYSLDANLRADGDSKFGPKNKWAYFPSISGRWNISDEAFFKPLTKVVSMLAFRPSWGMVGNTPTSDAVYYEEYILSNSASYGNTYIAYLDHLQADDLKWETTTSYNLGFNLGLFNDKIEATFEYYKKTTKDLLMSSVSIPTTTGYSSLSWQNVGKMTNEGWEVNVDFNDIVKKGKFSLSANFNISQNSNKVIEMDERVLNTLNAETSIANGTYMTRVQVGNAIGSIYGLKYKGVYQYSYEYLTNLATENNWSSSELETYINDVFLASGKTAPIATDASGKVIMESDGTPKRMVFHYGESDQTYFQGGDAIYEDINNDGEINELDVVYLGNSNPKLNGGFGLTFKYGNWTLRTSFNFRFGVKVVNTARMNLQSMATAYNQTAAVNYRWRKDGDVTPIPRAVFGTTSAYNYIGSDRYVEDASYVRFQYFQLTYRVPNKFVKSLGLNGCSFYASGNNLFCWTKYSGTDPEHSTSGFSYADDDSTTPRSRSFTVGINVSF